VNFEDGMMLVVVLVGLFSIGVCIYMWRLEIRHARESSLGINDHSRPMHAGPYRDLPTELSNEPLAAGEAK